MELCKTVKNKQYLPEFGQKLVKMYTFLIKTLAKCPIFRKKSSPTLIYIIDKQSLAPDWGLAGSPFKIEEIEPFNKDLVAYRIYNGYGIGVKDPTAARIIKNTLS